MNTFKNGQIRNTCPVADKLQGEEEFKADIVRAHGAKLRCQGRRRRSYEDIKLFTEACLRARRTSAEYSLEERPPVHRRRRRVGGGSSTGKKDGNYGLSRMCTGHRVFAGAL